MHVSSRAGRASTTAAMIRDSTSSVLALAEARDLSALASGALKSTDKALEIEVVQTWVHCKGPAAALLWMNAGALAVR